MRRTPPPLFPLTLVLFVGACSRHAPSVGSVAAERLPDGPAAQTSIEVERVARTPHLATYPCGAQCHDDRTPDPTPRALTTFHVGRTVRHGPALDFCDDCHDLDDVDSLVLLDHDTRVGFDASDGLCAQCHGSTHDDWEAGIHGLTTGGWRGTVQRRLCTACHDPHAPARLHFEALPVPADVRLRAPRAEHDAVAPGHDAASSSTEGP